MVASVQNSPGGETSSERDREPNQGAPREVIEHVQGGTRSSSSRPFVERAESREPVSSETSVPRAAVLVHGTAPVISQATLVAPLTPIAGEARAAIATPAPDTADRIVQSLKLQVQRGGGDAIVHLQPEHLGPVAISLRVENGAVSAVITAEQPAVAEWLQSNQQSLRDGLQASGLHLERFVVQRDGQSPSDRQRREWADARRREFRRRSPQTDSTFEISV
jgi:flagellar hook-length control protein FliK